MTFKSKPVVFVASLCLLLVSIGVAVWYRQATRQTTDARIAWNQAQFEAKHAECLALGQEISRNSETQRYDYIQAHRDPTLPSDTTAQDVSITSGLVTMAPVAFLRFPVLAAELRGSTPARLDASPATPRLLFDGTTRSCASWPFVVPPGTSQGTPTLHVIYEMTSGMTGSVVFGVEVRSATTFLRGLAPALLASAGLDVPDEDSHDACPQRTLFASLTRVYISQYGMPPLDAAPFDGMTTQASGVPPTLGHLTEMRIPLVHTDGMAACHLVEVQLCRLPDYPEDSAPGDAEVLSVTMRYGKTPR
jgi:hypothetical protein